MKKKFYIVIFILIMTNILTISILFHNIHNSKTQDSKTTIYLINGENSKWKLENSYVVVTNNKLILCGSNLLYKGIQNKEVNNFTVSISLIDDKNNLLDRLISICHNKMTITENFRINVGNSIVPSDKVISKNISKVKIEMKYSENDNDSLIKESFVSQAIKLNSN